LGKSKVLKAEAQKISRKLGGIETGGAHMKVAVMYKGEMVLDFGYRHAKTAPNGHLPRALHLSESDTIKMARCHISKDEYFEMLKAKGIIVDDA
jgi:hypothetical protein